MHSKVTSADAEEVANYPEDPTLMKDEGGYNKLQMCNVDENSLRLEDAAI
jgi:hypothetical protein